MDPDCGIKNKYLKPTNFIVYTWSLLSVVITIYLFKLSYMTADKFISSEYNTEENFGYKPSYILAVVLAFFLMTLPMTIVYFFRGRLPVVRNPKFYLPIIGLTTSLSMVFVMAFSARYGRRYVENKLVDWAQSFWMLHPDYEVSKWLKNKLGNKIEKTESYSYYRTVGASRILSGLMIPWFIFQCSILFSFLQENDYHEFEESLGLK